MVHVVLNVTFEARFLILTQLLNQNKILLRNASCADLAELLLFLMFSKWAISLLPKLKKPVTEYSTAAGCCIVFSLCAPVY